MCIVVRMLDVGIPETPKRWPPEYSCWLACSDPFRYVLPPVCLRPLGRPKATMLLDTPPQTCYFVCKSGASYAVAVVCLCYSHRLRSRPLRP